MAGQTAADLIREMRKKLERSYRDSTELFPDFSTIKQIDVIPSPSAIINAVTGIGGFPRGRVTEIYGPESTGKTTIAILVAVEAQRRDPNAVVLFADFEHAFDAGYAHSLGLDLNPDRFIFLQPEYFEQGGQVIHDFVEAGLVDMVVIDSTPAMTPKAELEGEIDREGGSQKGLQAAVMAQFLAKITKRISQGRKPALILINQTRAVIDIGGRPQKNAPKEQAAGGKAMRFYASVRLSLEILRPEGDTNRDASGQGTDQVYTQNRVRITAVKNKLAPPWVRGSFVLEYGKGINNVVSIAELAESRLGIMSGAGFFKYEGLTPATSFSCRGREAFQELLLQSPDTLREIEQKVLDSIRAEHAVKLGIGTIKVAGKAKEIVASDPGMVLLTSQGEGNAPGLPTVE